MEKTLKAYEEAKSYAGPAPDLPSGPKEQERILKEGYFKKKQCVTLNLSNTCGQSSTLIL